MKEVTMKNRKKIHNCEEDHKTLIAVLTPVMYMFWTAVILISPLIFIAYLRLMSKLVKLMGI